MHSPNVEPTLNNIASILHEKHPFFCTVIKNRFTGIYEDFIDDYVYKATAQVIIEHAANPFPSVRDAICRLIYSSLRVAADEFEVFLTEHGLSKLGARVYDNEPVNDMPDDFINNLADKASKVMKLRKKNKKYVEISQELENGGMKRARSYAGATIYAVKKRWKYFQLPENSFDPAFAATIENQLHHEIYCLKTQKFMSPQKIGLIVNRERKYVASILYFLKQRYIKNFLNKRYKNELESLRRKLKYDDILKEKIYGEYSEAGWHTYESTLCGRTFNTAAVDGVQHFC